ncbi:hypothetical protein [Thermogemmatispora tikiterensis]|uniref:hypothetical protein n=1 Tax=Thermogemmatispora tikiterensis TaxID=1825093 RepID=UPI001671BDB4|nr:hypothetical protein [Thermogemmatispora tikiterensis]
MGAKRAQKIAGGIQTAAYVGLVEEQAGLEPGVPGGARSSLIERAQAQSGLPMRP